MIQSLTLDLVLPVTGDALPFIVCENNGVRLYYCASGELCKEFNGGINRQYVEKAHADFLGIPSEVPVQNPTVVRGQKYVGELNN